MKNIFLISLVSFLLFSCYSDDSETPIRYKESTYYKMINFDLIEEDYYFYYSNRGKAKPIDLNNDGISNTNILLELDHYFSEPRTSDLEIKKEKGKKTDEAFASFYLPKQNFILDDDIPPPIIVQFEKHGFPLIFKENELIENYYVGREDIVIKFEKKSDTQYELILEKEFYDFVTSSNTRNWYKIVYEKM